MQHGLSFGRRRLFPSRAGRQGYWSWSRGDSVSGHSRAARREIRIGWLDHLIDKCRFFLDRHIEALFSFAGLRTRIVDEPRPERKILECGGCWRLLACCARQLAEHSLSDASFLDFALSECEEQAALRCRLQLALPNPRGSERRRKRILSLLRPLAIQCSPSSARFSARTLTPGSPRTPRSRPSVFCWINSRTLSSLKRALWRRAEFAARRCAD